MQAKKILLLGAAAIGVYYLWGKTKVNYNLVGFKFNPFRITFDILNPTNTPVKFNSIVADIIYNGNRIGLLNDFTPGTVPANSHTKVDFQVAADGLGVASVLSDISKNIDKISIQIIGTMKLNGVLLPINLIYNIR